MKSCIRRLLSRAWRLCGPLRQPLFRELDEHLAVGVERLSAELAAGQAGSARALAEMNLLTDSLARELIRLQIQLDRLCEDREQETLVRPWGARRRAA